MACMKLGSKSEVFYLDDLTWFCSTGLPSDVIIEVGEFSFRLHKFPLLSRSAVLEKLIGELSGNEDRKGILQLHDIPGGAKTFLLVAKFCYGVKVELTAVNIVSLRCAAEYLCMTEECGEGNLITQTENFLDEVFGSWRDSVRALDTCEEVLPHAEELHIVSRCINSLAMKACADSSLFSWPVTSQSELQTSNGTVLWNGISPTAETQPVGDDWWYDDVSYLSFPLFRRLILAVGSRKKPERVAGPIMHYAKRHLPLIGRESSFQNGNHPLTGSTASGQLDADQMTLLEEIVELLPNQKGLMPTKFLLRLLKTSMILQASSSCRETLEKLVGAQLDQAVLEDLLIPNMGYSVETLYDVDCVQRMLDHFMQLSNEEVESSLDCLIDEEELIRDQSLTQMIMVANLVDGYLAEVAPDVNLKPAKFQALAAVIPDYARPLDDGIYRAIDIYLKAHNWLTDSEKEELCRLLNCQKLSLEASTHAAQNERLPLRVIVQVLFFEQLRLRTSVTGWFFVSENLDSSQDPSGNLAIARNSVSSHAADKTRGGSAVAIDDVKERVSDLEKECSSMKQELGKLKKPKGGWNILRKLGLGQKSKPSEAKEAKSCNGKGSSARYTTPVMNEKDNKENGSRRG